MSESPYMHPPGFSVRPEAEEPPPPYSEEDPLQRQDENVVTSTAGGPELPVSSRSAASMVLSPIAVSIEEGPPPQEERHVSAVQPAVVEPDTRIEPQPLHISRPDFDATAVSIDSLRTTSNSRIGSDLSRRTNNQATHLQPAQGLQSAGSHIIPSPPSSLSPPLARLAGAHSTPNLALRRPRSNHDPSFSPSAGSNGKQHTEKYKIGRVLTESLVDVEHLKAHLCLLAAFKDLRQRVESCPDNKLPDIAHFLIGSQRWAWFVGLAVERFHRWVKYVKHTELATWVMDDIPPLDVLMIWHAYMLNPIWYAEDCDRIPLLRTLRLLNSYFISAVILIGDPARYEPCEERILSWFEQTDTPFDPLEAMCVVLHRAVRCPGCGRMNDVPFLDVDGTGYLQRAFSYACVCGLNITKTALALDKFAGDLVLRCQFNKVEPENCLAGTLHTRNAARGWHKAVTDKNMLLDDPSSAFRPNCKMSRDAWKSFLKEKFGYSISNIPKSLVDGMRRTMNAYTDDRPFSVDLAAAVLRQGTFIDTMESLGWLAPGFFDDSQNQVLLTHALARYHAFLDLLSSALGSYYVPTLDIDIVWHTHQLKGDQYLKECKDRVGWYVDHDDRVEESYHADGVDETCRAWQQRFGIPYMYCGCPLPDETLGSKLSWQFSRRLGLSKDHAALDPPQHPSAPDASHVSEHNAVRAEGLPRWGLIARRRRENRANLLRARRERDGRRVLEGKMDEELYRRGLTHISSSIMPVPLAPAGPGPSERWAAPCVVTFPGPLGTTGVGTCIAGLRVPS